MKMATKSAPCPRVPTPPPGDGDHPVNSGEEHLLLADGRLRLLIDPGSTPPIERWLPRFPSAANGVPGELDGGEGVAGPAAVIRIRRSGSRELDTPSGEPTIRIGSALAWVDSELGTVSLRGSDPRVRGTIDLAGLGALLEVPDKSAAAGTGEGDLYSMLTITAALLLGRLGRTPVHAGAVSAPGGGALLLAGDARAGKSTTCVNLIAAGWDYLSDDQIVLYRDPEHGTAGAGGRHAILVEGWPRTFHLDEGWGEGIATGNRRDFEPGSLGAGRWRRTATLEGVLFPVVQADRPTRLTTITAADALARLLRQTPWLLVDTASGPRLLDLLAEVARYPAYQLSLGLDTYRNAKRLHDCIAAR